MSEAVSMSLLCRLTCESSEWKSEKSINLLNAALSTPYSLLFIVKNNLLHTLFKFP